MKKRVLGNSVEVAEQEKQQNFADEVIRILQQDLIAESKARQLDALLKEFYPNGKASFPNNKPINCYYSPEILEISAKYNYTAVIKVLADNVTMLNQPIIIMAAKHGNQSLINILVNAGANLEVVYNGSTPLLWAADSGHFSIVQTLAAAGANINARDNRENDVWNLVFEKPAETGAPEERKALGNEESAEYDATI